MSAPHTSKRITDRYRIINVWEEVSQAKTYSPRLELPSPAETYSPRLESPSRAVEGLSEEAYEAYKTVFAALVEKGAWLQRAVAEGWGEADALAAELAAYALLRDEQDPELYEDAHRESLAAAYLLWPYHAARYYGYTEGLTPAERLESREALCLIQALLYNNVRGTLDVLRLWFHSASDPASVRYVTEPEYRGRWRPAKLLEFAPDLCAIDFLASHMLELVNARPHLRKALKSLQSLSLSPPSDPLVSAVATAFRKLRLAQMTVFYYPYPDNVGAHDEIPLYELVYDSGDDLTPARLIPFDGEEPVAKNFRKLASKIYSARNQTLYPHFFKHRRATIDRIQNAAVTSFISDGATTKFFLTTKPPSRKVREAQAGEGEGGRPEQGDDWPIWYSKALCEIAHDEHLPDWNDWEFWWRPIDKDDLRERLFPSEAGCGAGNGEGEAPPIHRNHHMSAYWDEMASEGQLLDAISIPREPPSGKENFGYLMELLLRREHEARTSFFFALAQTYEEPKGRLCQFVGGTFLGLERPGVPFSKERFESVAARVRGLVMAVAHYTTTYSVKRRRLQEKEESNSFHTQRDKVMRLLRGRKSQQKGPTFDRNGHLLFATQLKGGGTDHNSDKWQPSRHQIRRVFTHAEHLQEPEEGRWLDSKCESTWKSLFYLGGDAEVHFTLDKFLNKGGLTTILHDSTQRLNLSNREIACEDCFASAVSQLLGEKGPELKGAIKCGRPFYLPSRPGIRFVLALCRFVYAVQSDTALGRARVTGLEFKEEKKVEEGKAVKEGLVTIKFNNPSFVEYVLTGRQDEVVRWSHTAGAFRALKECRVFSEREARDHWTEFLNHPDYASSPLKLKEEELVGSELRLRWESML